MQAFNGRDLLMLMIGAFALTAITSLQGCRKLTEQEMIERGLSQPPVVQVQEDNVTRISSQLTRTVDTEKNVVCYTYDNPKSLQHAVSCLKD